MTDIRSQSEMRVNARYLHSGEQRGGAGARDSNVNDTKTEVQTFRYRS
jgi:hypothetical protein